MAKQLITLKNNVLKVEISTLGAEIQSARINDTEYIWDGNPDVWARRTPVLFPVCGGLKDDKYILNGKEYFLPKHGYAMNSEFEVENSSENSATFLLKSNEDTKKIFPFDYELRIVYTLADNAIDVRYLVTNKSDENMYFSIGGHEGYFCPEGIGEYVLRFDKKEKLTHNILNGNLLTDETVILGEDIDELPLSYDYFKIDPLTFLNLKSRAITLQKKDGGRSVRIDFEGFDYAFVWTKPDAKFICIEPWCGIPDFEGSSFDITQKAGIQKIEKGDTFDVVHTITFGG